MADDDIDKELQFHLVSRTADLIAAGVPADEAQRQARLEFGGVVQTKEACQDERRLPLLAQAEQDVSYTLRMMRRDPGFVSIVVLCLGLGIGASTAVFSVVDNLLFTPPRFEHADRLVSLIDVHPSKAPRESEVSPSPGNMLDWHDRAHSFDYMVAWQNWYYSYSDATGADRAESLRGVRVSAPFFSMLGVHAAMGRLFAEHESQAGADQVVILSHSFWLRRYNADPSVVGRRVLIDAKPATVIGVLPSNFQFYQPDLDVWMPLDLKSGSRDRQNHAVMVFARLAPGVSVSQAQQELDTITRALAREHADTNTGWGAEILPVYPSRDVRDVRPALVVLLVSSVVVLLIACVNVATLLLGRGIARQREMAIRAALGASRSRLIRQMLTESLALSVAGAVVGGVLAYIGVEVLVPLLPHAGTNQTLATFGPIQPTLDGRVLTFSIATTFVTGMLFGLLPAFETTRSAFLRTTISSSRPTRAGRMLIVAELTLSTVMLVAATLLLESFWQLQRVDPGFRADHLLTMPVWLPKARYAGSTTERFYEEVLQRIDRLPGVRSAAAVSYRPFLGMATGTRIEIDGAESKSPEDLPSVGYTVVTPGYLSVLEQRLLRGREFLETDTSETPGVAIVNEAMAKRFWPDQNPLGKRIRPAFSRTDVPWAMDASPRWLTIVGVAANIKEFRLVEQPRPLFYITYRQFPSPFMHLMIRTSTSPKALLSLARQAISAVDPTQPIASLQTMNAAVANVVPRFDVELFVIFAAISLFLSIIGVYCVASHSVATRTREIGIRMALGGRARDAVGLILGQTLLVSVFGTLLGTVGAFAVTRAMRNMLYGVSPADVTAFTGASTVLICAALAAAYFPARRAAQMNPTIALKWD